MKKAHMVAMLRQLKLSGNTPHDYQTTACSWLQNNTDLWKAWYVFRMCHKLRRIELSTARVPETECKEDYEYKFATNTCDEKDYELTVGATVVIGIGCIVAVISCAFGCHYRSMLQAKLQWWKLTKEKSEQLGVSLAYLLEKIESNNNGFEKDAAEAAQKVERDREKYYKPEELEELQKKKKFPYTKLSEHGPNFYDIKVPLLFS